MDKAEFRRRFPRLFLVRAYDRFEAAEAGVPEDRTWWHFMAPFEFVSEVWGPIVVPEGFRTDFASVPLILRSLYDDDSPILLYPSAPHDMLFERRADGTRGWLPDGRRLTMRQANLVLIEAMRVCGANVIERGNVMAAVEIANGHIAHEFAQP